MSPPAGKSCGACLMRPSSWVLSQKLAAESSRSLAAHQCGMPDIFLRETDRIFRRRVFRTIDEQTAEGIGRSRSVGKALAQENGSSLRGEPP